MKGLKTNRLRKLVILFSIVVFLCLLSSAYAETGTISIKAANEPISNVLYKIAKASNMGLILSKNVSGKVTVELKDIPLEEALKAVLQPNNLTYSIDNNIISVYTYSEYQQRERFAPLRTEVFTLENINVSALRRSFMSMKSPRGKVEFNLKGNQAIVTDTPENLKQMEEVVKKIDKKREIQRYKLRFAEAKDIKDKVLQAIPEDAGETFVDDRTNSIVVKAASPLLKDISSLIEGWDVQPQQVLIEAKILEVTLDNNNKLGIDWGSTLNLRNNMTLDFSKSGNGTLSVGTLTADEYQIALKMLESKGNTEVLSSPRVVVIDSHKANILVGSSEPYMVTSEDPTTGFISTDTKYRDVGLKLVVTPNIGEGGYITLTVHPEVSTSRRLTEVSNSLAIDTTQADTTMMVKDNETIILGGLMKDYKSSTYKKFPILGDIPLLGYLFRDKEILKTKKELVVFITPHILTDKNRQFISRQDIEGTIKRSKTTLNVLSKNVLFEQE